MKIYYLYGQLDNKPYSSVLIGDEETISSIEEMFPNLKAIEFGNTKQEFKLGGMLINSAEIKDHALEILNLK